MGQRPVDEHPDVVLASVGKDAPLDFAAEQVVRRLKRLHRPRARELGHLGRVVVGDAGVPDLSLPDERVEAAAVSANGTPGSGQCTW